MKFPHLFIFVKQHQVILLLLRCFLLTFFCFAPKINTCHNFSSTPITSSLTTLNLEGYFDFHSVHHVAKDFGNQHSYYPLAVLHPSSVSDIATTINHIFQLGPYSELTVAARGNGHSTQGQAQAYRGLVVQMAALSTTTTEMKVHTGKVHSYIDVSGGELWINVLHESLKYGLTPKSWTDYLHLSVGGTLSNAGISGQTFRHGPQISNVYQLDVVTGKGEVTTCSKQQNVDLFYAVLGGLGQFGIITRARIALAPAPKMVKWIRVVYLDFLVFTKDQEHLISSENTFDYVEGFVMINTTDLLSHWSSSFNPRDSEEASRFTSNGKTLFCLEIAKYYDPNGINMANQEVESLLSQLNFIKSTLFFSDITYMDFLGRVHLSEKNLRSTHPWLNLLIPRSGIHELARQVFGNIITDSCSGLILLYPLNKSKWDNRTSAVTPDEEIFYLVAFLSSAVPSSKGINCLEQILNQNRRIIDLCGRTNIGMKQYLAHYTSQKEWESHFGHHWETFVKMKSIYDPLAILAPGQRIFQKAKPLS